MLVFFGHGTNVFTPVRLQLSTFSILAQLMHTGACTPPRFVMSLTSSFILLTSRRYCCVDIMLPNSLSPSSTPSHHCLRPSPLWGWHLQTFLCSSSPHSNYKHWIKKNTPLIELNFRVVQYSVITRLETETFVILFIFDPTSTSLPPNPPPSSKIDELELKGKKRNMGKLQKTHN